MKFVVVTPLRDPVEEYDDQEEANDACKALIQDAEDHGEPADFRIMEIDQ